MSLAPEPLWLACLGGGLLCCRFALRGWRRRNENLNRRHLDNFTPLPAIGAFRESLPLFFPGGQRQEHAVLLLHGYSASPEEFHLLAAGLRERGLPHLAPLLNGFGLDDMHLLQAIKATDWLRDTVIAYDLLAALADNISVIGHSTGATLALLLARQRPLHHLILSAPNLVPAPADRRARALLTAPLISRVITALLPLVRKPVRQGRTGCSDTLDHEAARRCFHTPSVATASLREMWRLQDMIDVSRGCWHSLTLMAGAHDQTIDLPASRQLFDRRRIPYELVIWQDSAHNILEDHDRDAVTRAMIERLTRSPGSIRADTGEADGLRQHSTVSC